MSISHAPRTGRHEPTALWYLPVAEPGGVARHVFDVAAAGIPGWRLIVLCPEGPLADRLRGAGVRTVTAEVSPQAGPLRALRQVRRTITRLAPDLVHTHLAFADFIGLAASSTTRGRHRSRIRIVTTEHGISGVRGFYQDGQVRAWTRRLFHRHRLDRTDWVIAVSRSTAHQVEEQWKRRGGISVIPNGVTAPDAPMDSRPGLRVLSLARLAPEKRIDILIRAFAKLVGRHPEARLTIAGTGESEAELRQLATAEGLDEVVAFTGVIDPEQAMRDHDVIAQLSAWENLSYTLLDALTHGLGIVTTDVGGSGEIIPPRCLVDPGELSSVAAALTTQGLEVAARPRPTGTLSDVDTMCRRIAATYAEAML